MEFQQNEKDFLLSILYTLISQYKTLYRKKEDENYTQKIEMAYKIIQKIHSIEEE